MGCPSIKLVKTKLEQNEAQRSRKNLFYYQKVRSVLDIPLTVKMRTGWADASLAVENALAAEAA